MAEDNLWVPLPLGKSKRHVYPGLWCLLDIHSQKALGVVNISVLLMCPPYSLSFWGAVVLIPYIFRVISSLLVFSHGLQAGGVCRWSEMTARAAHGWQPVIMWIKGFLRSEGFPWCPWFPPSMAMAWKRDLTNGSQAVSSPWDVWVWLDVLVLEQCHWYQSIFHCLS